MIIVDIEATGTNPRKHSILSIGAVDLDNPERQFEGVCRIWEGAHIDGDALEFLETDESTITDPEKQTEAQLVETFMKWALEAKDHTVAAMHPMFDLSFLAEAADRGDINYPLAKRSVDLHSVAVAHMSARGINYPVAKGRSDMNSDYIMEYVGIPAEPRPHKALNGALWEAEAFSRLLYGEKLLPEFDEYEIACL